VPDASAGGGDDTTDDTTRGELLAAVGDLVEADVVARMVRSPASMCSRPPRSAADPPGGDLRVRETVGCKLGNSPLLGGEAFSGLDRARAGSFSGCQEFDLGPLGETQGPDFGMSGRRVLIGAAGVLFAVRASLSWVRCQEPLQAGRAN
jgi:hypothetical protein